MRAMMRMQAMWLLGIGATAITAPGRAAPATPARPAADPPVVLLTEADDDLDADAAVQRVVAELELADQGKPRTLTIVARVRRWIESSECRGTTVARCSTLGC
jgi:hypothetical protein